MSTIETPTIVADAKLPIVGQLGVGAISLLVANAGVLFLFLVYDVTLFQLVLVYWCECAWIGVFSALKLITASIVGDPYENRWAKVSPGSAVLMSIFVIVFVSTSFFSLLGVLLISILFANDALPMSNPGDEMFSHIGVVLGASILLMSGHALSFVVNFLFLGEYKTARVGTLVALPFKRCSALLASVALSIVVVAFVPRFASTTAFAISVIALKVLFDIRLHLKERWTFAELRAERTAQT